MSNRFNTAPERGGITLTIMLVFMLVVIGVLVYLLASGTRSNDGKTIGVSAPVVSHIAPRQNAHGGVFSDGLPHPDTITEYPLDETDSGIQSVAEFNLDINRDGKTDRITRTRHENGTSHFYDEYKIEINDGDILINITPSGFRTVQGAECALQKLHFSLSPDFRVTKISRKWKDSWNTPTPATRTIYKLSGDKLNVASQDVLGTVCDVTDLFIR